MIIVISMYTDVKLSILLGKPRDGIGYIQLTGFTDNTGRDVRDAIYMLQNAAEQASEGKHSLKVCYNYFHIFFVYISDNAECQHFSTGTNS